MSSSPAGRRPRRGRSVSADGTFHERALQALRTDRHRVTSQRRVLLDVIEHAGGHLDADGLYRLARGRDNRISLSTVYRTLALLKRHDLVDELHLSEEHHHYEAKTEAQHFHLLCTRCGEVEEFAGGVADRLRQELKREHGFEVTAMQLDIAGLCARCASKAA